MRPDDVHVGVQEDVGSAAGIPPLGDNAPGFRVDARCVYPVDQQLAQFVDGIVTLDADGGLKQFDGVDRHENSTRPDHFKIVPIVSA
jgi:hypothetical protein